MKLVLVPVPEILSFYDAGTDEVPVTFIIVIPTSHANFSILR